MVTGLAWEPASAVRPVPPIGGERGNEVRPPLARNRGKRPLTCGSLRRTDQERGTASEERAGTDPSQPARQTLGQVVPSPPPATRWPTAPEAPSERFFLLVNQRLLAELTHRPQPLGTACPVQVEVALLHQTLPRGGVREGAVVCEMVSLRSIDGGPPITRDMLRDVPVASLASALMANGSLIWDFSHPSWGDVDTSKVFVVGGSSAPAEVQAIIRQQTAPRRRRRITDELLREVATIYRRHVKDGAPTLGVADELKVSHSTAARYVSKARERGLLGRTTAGLGEGATSPARNEEQP